MKYSIIIITILLSVFAGCGKKPGPPAHFEMQVEEYEIYSILLSQNKQTNPDALFVIFEKTAGHFMVSGDIFSYLESSFPIQLKNETCENYVAKNEKAYILEEKFAGDLKILLFSAQNSKTTFGGSNGWKAFHGQYPGARGIIDFSRVGFNRERNQALVLYGCVTGGLSGSGNYYLLVKENGKWLIKGTAPGWIS